MKNVKMLRVIFLQLLWISYGELVLQSGSSIGIANRAISISSGFSDIEKRCYEDDLTSLSPQISTTKTATTPSTSPTTTKAATTLTSSPTTSKAATTPTSSPTTTIVPCQIVIPNILPGGKCPANFVYLNDGYCYYFSNITTSWDKSLAQCAGLNATLACPDTPYRNQVLRTYLKDVLKLNANSTAYWFGGYFDNSTMAWRWKCNNNKIECFDWCPKEPNNYGATEWCLSYNPQNTCDIHWNDRTCSWWGFRAICQTLAKYW